MIEELEQQIMELEKELSDKYSDILELETEYEYEISSLENELEKSDNKIIDLEYELFLEKTRGSKHSFYWFTAKKIPYDADVSYISKENYLYGFKQVPSYHYTEHYDLRFITNCSLDDLIEQFR